MMSICCLINWNRITICALKIIENPLIILNILYVKPFLRFLRLPFNNPFRACLIEIYIIFELFIRDMHSCTMTFGESPPRFKRHKLLDRRHFFIRVIIIQRSALRNIAVWFIFDRVIHFIDFIIASYNFEWCF